MAGGTTWLMLRQSCGNSVFFLTPPPHFPYGPNILGDPQGGSPKGVSPKGETPKGTLNFSVPCTRDQC